MNFSALLDGVDGVVEDHLCDDGLYFAGGMTPGEVGVPVRIIVEHPQPIERLTGMSLTRARPVMKVRRSRIPDLREKHIFTHGADVWQVAEAPALLDDGEWWVFEVQPG